MPERTYENESDVKAEIKKRLNKVSWYFWMPPGNGFGTSGVADFSCLAGNIFVAIEAKFGSNKPTALQRDFLRRVAKEGNVAIIVNEKNLDDFQRVIDTVERLKCCDSNPHNTLRNLTWPASLTELYL